MRRSEAQSFESVDFVHGFEQLHKWTFCRSRFGKFVPAVQVYDLPEQV